MGALEEGRFDEELDLLEPESESGSGSGSGPEPSVTRDIEDAVRVLLQGLGEDQYREGLKKTPHRVAKALREGTRGYRQKVKDIVQGALFPEAGLDSGTGYAGGVGGLVVVRDIDLYSYCESCLLPFSIKCHVGYVPSKKQVVGLSKLSRVADVYAKRLQDPQRLAHEICSALHNSIQPAGVAVVLQCWHIQFPEALRCNPNFKSVLSGSGVLEDKKSSLWNDYSALLEFKGVNLEEDNNAEPWCPSRSLEAPRRICSKPGSAQPAMVAAVASILHSLGEEDPLRKELVGTPYRHVLWLMNFKRSNLEIKLNTSIRNRGRHELHSELNLPFCSQCEHHLLPFHGVVHVGYFDEGEEGRAIERSILESLVHFYGCKLQVQERLTRQIVEAVYSILGGGVMVVVEASHICMISRGIEKVGTSTATIAVMGQFSTNPDAKSMFLKAISKCTASGG